MATLRELLRGTQKVHPNAIKWAPDRRNSPFQVFEVQKFKGMNSVIISSQQRSSGRWGPHASKRLSEKGGIYKQVMRFTLGEIKSGKQVGKNKPKASKDRCLVRCGCSNYYFMWWWGNKKIKAHEGGKFKKYVRKTMDRPEQNPQNIPGMCKHLVFVAKELKRKRIIQ